jgi:hypothetical protein
MFRLFSGWAIIRLRLEYRRKHMYHNVDIKDGGTRSRFTMFWEVCSYIYAMWNLRWLRLRRVLCRFIDMWAGVVFGSCFGRSVLGWIDFIGSDCGEDSWVCEVSAFKRGGLDK